MLKNNIVLLIETQEELNQLAEVEDGVEVDALHINEPYLAFIDEVLWIVPQSGIDASHWASLVRPTLFRKWYKKQKRIL